MMRSFVFASSIVCALALAACSGSAIDADASSAEAVVAAAPLDSFGRSLVGKYTDGGAPGATKEFASLALRTDGTYTAEKPSRRGTTVETGKFTASATALTLTLKPKGSKPARTYAAELSDDFSSLTLTNGANGQYLISATPVDCRKDEDCGAGRTCLFGDQGKQCVASTPTTPGADPGDSAGGPATCATRRGGAFITLDVAGEKLAIWSTNKAFIDAAKLALAGGEQPHTVNFDKVIDGPDCDTRYSWHVIPNKMTFGGFAIEQCDGTPAHLEANKATWIRQVGRYCPWGPKVIAVEDRR